MTILVWSSDSPTAVTKMLYLRVRGTEFFGILPDQGLLDHERITLFFNYNFDLFINEVT